MRSSTSPVTESTDNDKAALGRQTRVVLAYLVCAAIWGTTWYAIRVCIAPGCYPVYPAAAIRFTVCSIILSAFWIAYRGRIEPPTRTELVFILIGGGLSGIAYGLLYDCEQQISGGVASVIASLGPLVAAAIAMLTGTEKPTGRTISGALLALAGVAIVFHDRMQVSVEEASAIGVLLFNLFISQTSNVLMKRQAHHVAVLPVNTLFFLGSAVVLWVGAIFKGQLFLPPDIPLRATIALLYLTFFGTLITFAAWFYLLKRVRLSTATTLAFVTPIIALIVDAFYEKKVVLGAESYVGFLIILLGVAATVLFNPRLKSLTIFPARLLGCHRIWWHKGQKNLKPLGQEAYDSSRPPE